MTAWACEAYGPDGEAVGALCFVSDQDQRSCASPAACHVTMTAERQRLWQRLQLLAATGDDVARELLTDFTSPEQLLGGEHDPDPL